MRRLVEGSITVLHRGSAPGERSPRARDLQSLLYMTHLQCSRSGVWTDLAVDECDPADIAPVERYECLER